MAESALTCTRGVLRTAVPPLLVHAPLHQLLLKVQLLLVQVLLEELVLEIGAKD